MKKLINLIALVMLVSTNVLTHLSYAQVETPEAIPENEVENIVESGETPEYMDAFSENVSNDLGEIEQENQDNETPEDVLQNIQDDIETSTTDETENVDTENNEEDQPAEEISENEIQDENLEGDEMEDDLPLQKIDEFITMEVEPGTTATLLSGIEFNAILKRLAGDTAVILSTNNSTIKQIVYTGTMPSGVATTGISTSDSEKEVVAWYDSGIIYYYTQAETIYMNSDSRYMFYHMQGLINIDIVNLDASRVTNMYSMFEGCESLTELNLSSWNTSNVTSMSYMFYNCRNLEEINLDGRDFVNTKQCPIQLFGYTSLKKLSARGWKLPNTFSNMMSWFGFSSSIEEIDATDWDLENTTNISYMFGYSKIKNIKGLNTRKNTSNVTDMEGMFYNCSNLTGLDMSGWDTSSVTSMQAMFNGCSKLEEINLNGWDFRKVGSSLPMRSASNIKKFDMENTKFSGSISYAFHNLTSLEEINLSGADVSSVTNMSYMFVSCTKLTDLNVNWMDNGNVGKNVSYMFDGCSGLTGLDLSDWDTRNVTNMSYMFNNCQNLTTLNLGNKDISSVANMSRMFSSCTSLTDLNVNWVDNGNVGKNVSYMFDGCSGLTGLDLSDWDTSNVTNMAAMFYGCSNLTSLNLSGWDTSNVTNMGFGNGGLFGGCNKLEEINLSGWDFRNLNNASLMMYITAGGIPALTKLNMTNTKYTGSASYAFGGLDKLEELKLDGADTRGVTNMNAMFQSCSNLTGLDLSNFDTSNVTNMYGMFGGCSKLENLNLDNWDLGKNPDMGSFIGGTPSLKIISMSGWKIPENFQDKIGRNRGNPNNTIEEIDVTNWDLSKTKNLQGLFGDTTALKTIKGLDTWDTSGVTNMYGLFYSCNNLMGLDLSSWDTSNVTDMGVMFYNCSSLNELDLSNFDTSNVNNMQAMFGGCSKLEEINLSGWDFRNLNNASLMMNITAGGIPALTKLNMTNTKYTGSAGYAFGGLNKLEELNLNGADTSNVTSMNAMFNGDSNLKILDLGGLDTSNVKDMSAMFYNCSSLTGLNLNNFDTSSATSMGAMFYGCSSLNELDLSNFDTSSATSMGAMFYGCSSLNELDLSNFDTSKVTTMGQMFYNTPNLKTIYASEKFVTTALSGDTSSKDMFSGTTSVIGGNGTKFDPNYIDEEYALIDKVGQTGYFTDKNSITVKFINTLDGTETLATFAKGQKLTPPSVDKYHVAGGYLDEAMTQEIDLNKGVDSYTVIYVKYDHNGSSGGGGGGGGSTKPDTPKDEQQPAEPSQSDAFSGTDVKEPETNTGSNIQTGSQADPQSTGQASEQTPQNDGKTYTQEFQEAYEFAKGNGITTMPTIQKANMEGKLTRIAMAKMLSQYAMNVLGQKPANIVTPKFNDVTDKQNSDYDDGVTLAYQLGIMGQNMPGNKFRPNDEVSRAEFATALSRLLYQTTDGKYKSTKEYYIPHMAKLYNEGIISNTDPSMSERRGYVMIMLMRSAK